MTDHDTSGPDVQEPAGAGPVAWRREQERSLWLHREVAAALLADPDDVLTRARRNLDHLDQVHHGTVALQAVQRWRELLEQGPAAVHDVLVGLDPGSSELRQSSPFAGVLEPVARERVLRAFAAHWRARASVTGPAVR